MARRQNHNGNVQADQSNAWELSTKREGDRIGSWVIAQLYEQNKRELRTGERCKVTSFCYPTGARLVRAKLERANAFQANRAQGVPENTLTH